MGQPPLSIRKHFRRLKDPRRLHGQRHLLLDIIAIAICGVICGCDDWQQIVTFGRARREWLARFLELPNGIPSHDTFERVFNLIDPAAFQACFRAWMAALTDALGLKHIAIDGKTLRRSGRADVRPLHLVSAWATAHQVSLGQLAVADKSNEIPAIPQLLDLLDVNGALVTIDAMGCQKDIAAKIRARGGDYVLQVKDNQPTLLADIQACFARAFDTNFADCRHDEYVTEDRGHGRREKRHYTILIDPAGLQQQALWTDLRVIGICTSERTAGGKTSTEARYFIGSRTTSAAVYGRAARNHWGIENNLHWQMDVTFGEDKNRVSNRHGADNLAALRRLALTLLKQHPDKRSIACKRLEAALNTDFLEEVVRHGGASEKV